MVYTILLTEDEASIRDMLAYRLRSEGYNVITSSDGPDALEAAHKTHPDLIILDLMLPKMDGLEVCKQLRANTQFQSTPIIMLTARVEESDKIIGLELGADDYVTKPFSWPELRARIRTQLRRTETGGSARGDIAAHGVLEADDMMVDIDRRLVTRKSVEIELAARLFDLLVYFIQQRGLVLTRAQLLETVWGYDYDGDNRTVDVHVRWLREKIEDDPSNPQFIQTVRGVGYRFKM